MSFAKQSHPITDFLQDQFGNTKIQVLFQDSSERYVYITSEQGIGLELAKVYFKPAFSVIYPEIYEIVTNGGFIGKTFANHKIPFYRNVQRNYTAFASPEISEAFDHTPMVRAVELDIYVGFSQTHIATIIELYSSVVQWPERPPIRELDSSLVNAFGEHLKTLKTNRTLMPSKHNVKSAY